MPKGNHVSLVYSSTQNEKTAEIFLLLFYKLIQACNQMQSSLH